MYELNKKKPFVNQFSLRDFKTNFLATKNFNINLQSILMAYGVTGNTSDFGSEESRFEP